MRILQLTYIDADNGAAIAAHRLHRGLRTMGCESTLFVAEKRTEDPHVVVFQPPRDLASRVRRRWRRIQIARSAAPYRGIPPTGGWFVDDRSPFGADALSQLPPSDVIHVHSLLKMADYKAFFTTVPLHTPVVQTLHEMIFLSGGCTYDMGCGKYTERCGACPQLRSRKERDLSRQIWERKREALSRVPPGRLHFISPSRWLANEARRSSLLKDFPVDVIPLSLDTEMFRPRDRKFAREVLGVPEHASVVLFIGEPIRRLSKGFTVLAQALDGLSHMKNLMLLSVGTDKPPAAVSIPHLRLRRIVNEGLLSLAYSAADLFVIPSFQENFPQVALEATACGTPVVGFAVGGIPDIVQHGTTGLLVPAQDIAALREAIRELLEKPQMRLEMAANCRRIALKEYAPELQARRHIELYKKITSPLPAGQNRAEEPAEMLRDQAPSFDESCRKESGTADGGLLN